MPDWFEVRDACIANATHLHPLAVYEQGLHGEVDADGIAVAFDERAGSEALYHACLARPAVADQHNFEQVVEAFVARAHHQVVGIATRHSPRRVRDHDDDDDDVDDSSDGDRASGLLRTAALYLSTPSSSRRLLGLFFT